MSCLDRITLLPAAISGIAFLIGMAGPVARADESGGTFSFEEQSVEYHNQDVKLAGSLFLPKSEAPVPAVVFVHGAVPQTREPYREAGEFFASQGIAALIYDKRGCGQSGGTYESYAPYENLVNDALAGIALLKQRREIDQSKLGIWGLSQGAYISAAAASESDDIRFIVVVGAEVADGMLFYYRDNLFRRYGLSDTLRDVAEKASLLQWDLSQTLQDGFRLSSFAARSYPPPDEYVHPAWSHVQQPVLAMWGQLDQNVPVGESVAGLKNSLALANNQNWTILILPRTNHDLKISETGAIQSQSRGYPPGALKTMTDWAHRAIDHPAEIEQMKQEGVARDAGVLARLAGYESLRWYGNATVQTALWLFFLISFLANTLAGVWYCATRVFRRRQGVSLPASDRIVNWKRAIGALNLLILIALSITVVLVVEQLHPSCPSVLLFLPLLGSVSALATVALLIELVRTRRGHSWTGGWADGWKDCWAVARRIRFSLDVLALVLFVPYLFYWNVIGLHF